jgi:DNA polymerase-3 subunit alpha
MVTLAGVVTSARTITTKKGDPMAFATIEDPTGALEVTIFPKTYAKTKEVWANDKTLIVQGKVESRDGKVKILCESATEYVVAETPQEVAQILTAEPDENAVQYSLPDDVEQVVAESQPPPPEEPPLEFSAAEEAGNGNGNGKASASAPPIEPSVQEETMVYTTRLHDDQPRQIVISLTRTNDQAEDVRRLRDLFQLLTSVQGRDHFVFIVPSREGSVEMDFPNHSTSYALIQESLHARVSEWGTLQVQ